MSILRESKFARHGFMSRVYDDASVKFETEIQHLSCLVAQRDIKTPFSFALFILWRIICVNWCQRLLAEGASAWKCQEIAPGIELNILVQLGTKNLVQSLPTSASTWAIVIPETAEVSLQLDSSVGGDIYRPMHPLRTFIAFHKLREKIFKWKKETA